MPGLLAVRGYGGTLYDPTPALYRLNLDGEGQATLTLPSGDLGWTTLIPLPSTVRYNKNEQVSWATYNDTVISAGFYSDNMVVTPTQKAWTLGILAPTSIPDVELAAGPGITGDILCYLSWWDDDAQERSPLSAASATLAAANQKIKWNTFPASVNPRVTHIELWRSVNGSVPFLVMRRQLGITTVTEAVAAADLGEAFVEDFDVFPRCKYAAIWHDRLILAGDAKNPHTIYLSLVGYPERFSGLTMLMKSRQPITGLTVVNDQLLVFGMDVTERVSGFTETDLNIEIAQPGIGCICNAGIVHVHTNVWIPTIQGYYLSDGSGWYFMMKDVYTKWEELYARPGSGQFLSGKELFEQGWAVHDQTENIIKFYIGDIARWETTLDSAISAITSPYGNAFWVGDYTPVLPQTGGDLSQPNWSWDTSARAYTCGGAIHEPDGTRVVYMAGDGSPYNVQGATLKRSTTLYRMVEASSAVQDSDDAFEKECVFRTGWDAHSDVGGDLAHGKRWTDDDVFVRSELSDWEYRVFSGDEDCHEPLAVNDSWFSTPSFSSGLIQASLDLVPLTLVPAAPKGTHRFYLPAVVGRGRVSEIVVHHPRDFEFRGLQTWWKEGPASRMRKTAMPPGT